MRQTYRLINLVRLLKILFFGIIKCMMYFSRNILIYTSLYLFLPFFLSLFESFLRSIIIPDLRTRVEYSIMNKRIILPMSYHSCHIKNLITRIKKRKQKTEVYRSTENWSSRSFCRQREILKAYREIMELNNKCWLQIGGFDVN